MTMAWSQEDAHTLTEPASLSEKLELIKQIEMIEQEKVQMLKTKLSSEQWTALNMKIQYQARKGIALKQVLEVAEATGGRAQRRNVICAWVLDPTKGKCYQNVSMGLTMEQEWTHTEHWQCKSLESKLKTSCRHSFTVACCKWREVQSCPGVFELR